MKDTYTYRIGENLYVNLTNRCTNRCEFCVRNGKETYEGHALWLHGCEPSAADVISEIKEPKGYSEVVFCGFGEPTERLSEMLEIATHVHNLGGKTRLNTNGHGDFINNRPIARELFGKIDAVNISLNAPTAEEYEEICKPLIPDAFDKMLSFAEDCKACGLNAWFSVVDIIGKEKVARCQKVADEIGIPLRVRAFIP